MSRIILLMIALISLPSLASSPAQMGLLVTTKAGVQMPPEALASSLASWSARPMTVVRPITDRAWLMATPYRVGEDLNPLIIHLRSHPALDWVEPDGLMRHHSLP